MEHNVLEIHTICTYQNAVPFNGWVVFHGMDMPQFVYVLTCWRTFGLLPVWASYEQGRHVYLCTSHGMDICFHFSLANNREQNPRSSGKCMFNFLKKLSGILQFLRHFTFPQQCVRIIPDPWYCHPLFYGRHTPVGVYKVSLGKEQGTCILKTPHHRLHIGVRANDLDMAKSAIDKITVNERQCWLCVSGWHTLRTTQYHFCSILIRGGGDQRLSKTYINPPWRMFCFERGLQSSTYQCHKRKRLRTCSRLEILRRQDNSMCDFILSGILSCRGKVHAYVRKSD